MTSSNENICCVTGLLWGEFTGHRWIPLAKASDVELSWSALEQTVEQTTETPVIWDAIVFIMMPLECVMTFEANLGLYIQYIGHSKKKSADLRLIWEFANLAQPIDWSSVIGTSRLSIFVLFLYEWKCKEYTQPTCYEFEPVLKCFTKLVTPEYGDNPFANSFEHWTSV